MRKAKEPINADLQNAAEMIKGIRRAELVVRFRYKNADGTNSSVKSMKASALYKDWYEECNFCPSNDTVISGLHILLPTHTAIDILPDVTFEQFMDVLETAAVGHKAVA